MLRKFWLRRRLRKVDKSHPEGMMLSPDYLLALAECLDVKHFLDIKIDAIKSHSIHTIRTNLRLLASDVENVLDKVEKSAVIPAAVVLPNDQRQDRLLDDYLVDNANYPIGVKEVITNDLIVIKQLLASILIYREQDQSRFNYYVRKLQNLLVDIYVLLEALIAIALH